MIKNVCTTHFVLKNCFIRNRVEFSRTRIWAKKSNKLQPHFLNNTFYNTGCLPSIVVNG